MKAVLVIDMPDGIDLSIVKGSLTVTSKNIRKLLMAETYRDLELKPMPSKKEIDIETDLSSGSADNYISGYKDGYSRGVDVGWNRCVSEISGREE